MPTAVTPATPLDVRHRGYTVRRYKELNTRDGVAFTCEITLNGAVIGTAENTGTGGATSLYFQPRSAEEGLKALTGLTDDNGTSPVATTEDIVMLLIAACENEKASRKSTLVRTEPNQDNGLNLRDHYRVKGRQTLDEVRASVQEARGFKATQLWVPGQGWVVITTGQSFA